MKTKSSNFDNPVDIFIKQAWETIPGMITISAVAILGTAGFIGIAFRVGAYVMNGYKDFKQAAKR